MAAMHPVYLLATFAGLVAYNAVLRGAKSVLSGMLWQAPLVLILAIANPLFDSAGSTELFRIGLHAVYLEALCYGLCQGLMLVNVLLAFSIAARVVSSDKVLCVLGNATPTLALMISITMRLVPQFVRRGKAIADTQKACTAAAACGEFKFYPRIAGFAPWFSYIPYVLLVALPTILEAKERRTWLR